MFVTCMGAQTFELFARQRVMCLRANGSTCLHANGSRTSAEQTSVLGERNFRAWKNYVVRCATEDLEVIRV